MPGFDFSNFDRNQALVANGCPAPRATSTGTTIVGCIFNDGVVIAADTRATSGPVVADKNCEKLHFITPQIWCAGAGTAADTEFTTAMVSSNLELHALYADRRPRVATCMTMLKQYLFRYQGHIGAYLVIGGVDPTGPQLYSVHAHGSTDKVPFITSGSGSLAAMSVFETEWKANLTREEAEVLCATAIRAGIMNDLGSGSNIDICVIRANETKLTRNYQLQIPEVLRERVKPNERGPKARELYALQLGTTAVLDKRVYTRPNLQAMVSSTAISPDDGSQMDVDV